VEEVKALAPGNGTQGCQIVAWIGWFEDNQIAGEREGAGLAIVPPAAEPHAVGVGAVRAQQDVFIIEILFNVRAGEVCGRGVGDCGRKVD